VYLNYDSAIRFSCYNLVRISQIQCKASGYYLLTTTERCQIVDQMSRRQVKVISWNEEGNDNTPIESGVRVKRTHLLTLIGWIRRICNCAFAGGIEVEQRARLDVLKPVVAGKNGTRVSSRFFHCFLQEPVLVLDILLQP